MQEAHCYDKFMGEEEPYLPREQCKFYVVSAPYEETVSYEGGTAKGPAALIAASDQLEHWDGEGPILAGLQADIRRRLLARGATQTNMEELFRRDACDTQPIRPQRSRRARPER